MLVLARLVSFLIGYAFGNISPGLIFAKASKVDLRKSGSGNVGSTNVARTLGFKVGILTLLCDCLKAVIPAIIAAYAVSAMSPELPPRLLASFAAFGAVIGHIFPAALKFKGGKGIATSLGFLIVACPQTVLGCLVVFLVSVIATRYVSLGSILCAIVLPIEAIAFYFMGILAYPGSLSFEIIALFFLDAIICAYKHKDNIIRLKNGTENKFTIKKAK